MGVEAKPLTTHESLETAYDYYVHRLLDMVEYSEKSLTADDIHTKAMALVRNRYKAQRHGGEIDKLREGKA